MTIWLRFSPRVHVCHVAIVLQLQLTKSLDRRMWDDSAHTCRQLPGVTRPLAAKLAQHCLGTLEALMQVSQIIALL